MRPTKDILGALTGTVTVLTPFVAASQPGAEQPVPGPMRDLIWGKLNFLHTTDTHGWHAGHLLEGQYSADWGDYISFAQHMRKKADDHGVDLLLVDTGDRVEGNGLYDASKPPGKYYYDIYREQHIDIICSGNHELYKADTADREHEYSVPNFRDVYIASNLDYIDPKTGERKPMARRYRKFRTKNQKLDIVAFGFLFDFTGNANNTITIPVQQTIEEIWFQQAIREETDLFVVIGHVGVQMDEFKEIHRAIRQHNPDKPILFFGGHAHVRDATQYDSRSFALASGRYFETIGWMSIDGELKRKEKHGDLKRREETSSLSFHRRYIDNNLLGLYHHSGLNSTTFHTEHGRNVSAMITKARKELNLDYAFGCAPKSLWMSRAPYPSEDSIYSWLETEVFPDVVVNASRKDIPRLVIANTGVIRFDIFEGPFTIDSTYIVSPFTSKFVFIPDVAYSSAHKVLKLLNSAGRIFADSGPMDNRFMANPEQFAIRESIIYDNIVDSNGHQKPMDTHGKTVLTPGYTTRDDIGTDGDDTIHAPINFYVVPNCFQAKIGISKDEEPKNVDLVFLDFIKPWVLAALDFLGTPYQDEDVLPYVEERFTDMMAGWIEKNWPKRCDENGVCGCK